MYPNYIYYETPKLVTVGLKPNRELTESQKARYNKNERFYSTIQEVLFSEILLDKETIQLELDKNWDSDIFSSKPYNKEFWKNYNVLDNKDLKAKVGTIYEDLDLSSNKYVTWFPPIFLGHR